MWRRSPPCSIERAAVAVLLVWLAAAPGWAAEIAPDTAETKVRSVLADPRYQRNLPLPGSGSRGSGEGAEAPGGPGLGRGRRPQPTGEIDGRPAAPGVPEKGTGDSGSPAAPVLPGPGADRLALLILAVLGVVALVLFLLRGVQARRERWRPAAPAAAPGEAREAPAGHPFGDADRLAAQGLYTEAVHVLLLQALRHLTERFRVPLQPSRTSREVLRVLPLKPERHEVLADLVRMVERSLFGGSALGLADYEKGLGLARLLVGPGGAA
jgi:Domain of unknown function (DUF4129)